MRPPARIASHNSTRVQPSRFVFSQKHRPYDTRPIHSLGQVRLIPFFFLSFLTRQTARARPSFRARSASVVCAVPSVSLGTIRSHSHLSQPSGHAPFDRLVRPTKHRLSGFPFRSSNRTKPSPLDLPSRLLTAHPIKSSPSAVKHPAKRASIVFRKF